jgi:hypothetical protein
VQSNSEPADQGLQAWTFDPNTTTSANGGDPTRGSLYLFKMKVPQTITATGIELYLSFRGFNVSSVYYGLYSAAGVLIGKTADQSARTVVGPNIAALVGGPFTIIGGPGVFVWGAFLANSDPSGTLQPAVVGTGGGPLMNVNLTPATAMVAVNGTGLSSLPSTIAPSSNDLASNTNLFWMAIT